MRTSPRVTERSASPRSRWAPRASCASGSAAARRSVRIFAGPGSSEAAISSTRGTPRPPLVKCQGSSSAEVRSPAMKHVLWVILFVAALTAIWSAGLPVLAVLLAVLCGLAGLLYFIAGAARAGDGRTEQEREGYERFLKDIPPPPG